jgi:hypothetical protein
MMRGFKLRHRAIPLGLAASGWLVLGITLVGGHNLVRSLAVFAFAFFGPGVAIVRLLPIRDFLERLVLAIALGLSLAVLAAEATAIGHVMQPTRVLAVLAVICSGAALIELTGEADK